MAQNIDILISAKDNATKEINRAKGAIIDLQGSVRQLEWIWSSVFSWLKTWLTAVWVSLTALAAVGLKSSASMEQTNIAFKTLYGSAEEANKVLNNLADFAAKTPFEFPELADAARKLQSVWWVARDDLIPTLTSLGDIASSQWKNIDMIAEAFNDAVVWEFERLKEFGIRASQEWDKVTFTYKGQTEVVQKNNEAIADYITRLGRASGVAGSMDSQSNTLNGRLSTMKDNFNFLSMEILGVTKSGEVMKWGFFDIISNALKSLSGLFETYRPQIMGFFKQIGVVSQQVAVSAWEWWAIFGDDVKELWQTIKDVFNDKWPIALEFFFETLKTTFALIWIAIKWLNAIFRWDFFEIMKAWFEELWFFIQKKFDEFIQWFKNFATQMYQEAKMFAVNFMGMLGDWITEGIGDLQNKASQAASVLSDYLWFHSPTKKWPWSDADKWMPNLMRMLITGIDDWEAWLRQSAVRVASVIWQVFSVKQFELFKEKVSEMQSSVKSAFDNLTGSIWQNKSKILGLKDDYNALKQKLKEIWDEWKKEIDKITQSIVDQQSKISWIKNQWAVEVATRILEIEKELNTIQKARQEFGADVTNLDVQKAKLEAEMRLAQLSTTQEDISNARNESEKNTTQLILDRYNKQKAEAEIELQNLQKQKEEKILAIEAEKTAQKVLMEAKKIEIESEYTLYKSLIEQRKLLDNEYFSLFGIRIKRQMDETKQAIELLRQYNSMATGWVNSQNSWEVFKTQNSPASVWWSSNNISINMWWMTVNNRWDADYFVEKLKSTLIRELQLSKLGIS